MKLLSTLLMKLNMRRAQKIANYCKDFVKPGENILDIGSGSGYISYVLQQNYKCSMTCLDIIDYNQVCQNFMLYDGTHMPFKDGIFDKALVVFVLHHDDDPIRLLQEAKRVLKSGGLLVIFEDIYTNKLQYLTTIAMDLLLNLYYGAKTPFKFKTESEWLIAFKQLGLELHDKKLVRLGKFDLVRHMMFVLSKPH